jgi:hypothetical protein
MVCDSEEKIQVTTTTLDMGDEWHNQVHYTGKETFWHFLAIMVMLP